MENKDESQMTRSLIVYFPLKLASRNTGLLYGHVHQNADGSNFHVYVSHTDSEKTAGGDSECLENCVGILNKNEKLILHTTAVWISVMLKQDLLMLDSAEVAGLSVPILKDTILILYEDSLLQSKLLSKNINWSTSFSLTKLVGGHEISNEALARKEPPEILEYWRCLTSVSKVAGQLTERLERCKRFYSCQSQIELNNLLLLTAFDLVLSLLLMLLLHQSGGTDCLTDLFVSCIAWTAEKLQVLVEWLNGVPAGLKLNRPLSTVLAKFFLYHLYLWKTYIDIIRPVLSSMISVASVVGLLGVSLQLAILGDLITLASLHCYCFYVYAARLYGVTLQGLQSTLRMFGGRKWNPLRKRVDSGSFTWDQLCLGMFIASSLLLLLPTILVYYIVFLALRLTILATQESLKRITWLVNSMPLYSLMLWFFNSPLLAGDVQVVTVGDGVFRLVPIRLSLMATMCCSVNHSVPPRPFIDWSRLLHEIAAGQLLHLM